MNRLYAGAVCRGPVLLSSLSATLRGSRVLGVSKQAAVGLGKSFGWHPEGTADCCGGSLSTPEPCQESVN